MKNAFLIIVLSVISPTIFAMEEDTPASVALFLTLVDAKAAIAPDIYERFNGRSWEQLNPEEKTTVVKKNPMPGFTEDQLIDFIDVQLPTLTALIASQPELLKFVPYGYRKSLPEACRSIIFKECIPFYFAKEKKYILSIGGTSDEVELLAQKYNVDASSVCTLNVLGKKDINYFADMNNAEHMSKFAGKFDIAFVSAVPFSETKVAQSFNNIASTLNQNGIFVGYASAFNFSADPADLLVANGFACAKTIFRTTDGAAWFMASKAQCNDLEATIASDSFGKGIYDYVMSDLVNHRSKAR